MAISAQQVRVLRDKTGAAMMDCKRALEEAGGDMEKARVLLRERGLAKAGKREGRTTKEGVVDSYVHGNNKLGVLVEVGCESDFVARNAEFTSLVKEIKLQIAAMKPRVVRREDLSQEVIEQEEAIAAAQVKDKPAQAVEKIVAGKMQKFFAETCLLDQPWIRDGSKTIRNLIDEAIAKLGEKIEVRRFVILEFGVE
jgi:elongation factor Ts